MKLWFVITGTVFRANFRFQPKVCGGCHEKIQKSMDAATVTVYKYDYWINVRFMAKSEAMNETRNSNLSKRGKGLWIGKNYFIIEMFSNTVEIMPYEPKYRKRNKGKFLEKSKRYYEENNRDLYKVLSGGESNKRREHYRNRY